MHFATAGAAGSLAFELKPAEEVNCLSATFRQPGGYYHCMLSMPRLLAIGRNPWPSGLRWIGPKKLDYYSYLLLSLYEKVSI